MMRDIAIVSVAQLPSVRRDHVHDEPELVQAVVHEALGRVGLTQKDIGFTCSGSSDYLVGRPFSFVAAVDGLQAWPPIRESHVEMDGAWALFESYVQLLHGAIDTALVFAFGKSSLGPIPDILNLQNDPYYVQPLNLDSISAAALQAQALIDAGKATRRDFAAVAVRSRAAAKANPNAQIRGDFSIDDILAEPTIATPLSKSLCPPLSDASCALVLAAGDKARELCARPAWIRGIDHRIESALLGARDLTHSESTKQAAQRAGVGQHTPDIAEIMAPFAHQELILREALGLSNDVDINPSGGCLAANPIMAAGLLRFIEAAARIHDGHARCAVVHATSGACLQQNMVAVLEAEA